MNGDGLVQMKPGKQMIYRAFIVLLALVVATVTVSGYSLIKLMIVDGEKLQTEASKQQLYDSLITAPRGDIYDRNMQTLATSTTAWTVYITPNGIRKIEDDALKLKVRETIATNLSAILEVEYETVFEQTDKNSYYVIVKKKIEKTVAETKNVRYNKLVIVWSF